MKKHLIFVLSFCFVFIGGVPFGMNQLWSEPLFKFHGQFRVNSYSDYRSNKDKIGDFNRAASRLRWRPTIDVDMGEGVKLYTQLNIGHINSNLANACGSGADCFMVRHAVIQAELLDTGITGVAGLVPISDKFGDTLFSADWDYNPLALVLLANEGDIKFRAGFGKLSEGATEGGFGGANASDDLDIYVFDADFQPLGIGGSVYWMHGGSNRGSAAGSKEAMAGGGMQELDLVHYGVRYRRIFFEIVKFDAFLVGSHLNANNFFGVGAGDLTSNGVAGKLNVKIPLNGLTLGFMAIAASGDKNFGVPGTGNASSFITPMSLVGSTGYWGYTGRLTEQGTTDTGIDDWTVNLDGGGLPWSSYRNLGFGLLTIQGNLAFPISDIFSTYLGVGTYSSMDTPSGQSSYLGTDFYAEGKLNLSQNLNLEFGIDYLAAGKGHYNNVSVVTASGVAENRGITTLFSRLQLEY